MKKIPPNPHPISREAQRKPYILSKILINYLFTLALLAYITDESLKYKIKYLFYCTRRFNVYLDKNGDETRGVL